MHCSSDVQIQKRKKLSNARECGKESLRILQNLETHVAIFSDLTA